MIQKLKELIEAASPKELEAIRRDDPRGQPSPMYRALLGLCHSPDSYVAVVHKDGSEFDPSPGRCEATALLIAFLVNHSEDFVRMAEEANFLVDRLTDFENSSDTLTEDGVSDYHGHVAPSLSRLRKALAALNGEKQ